MATRSAAPPKPRRQQYQNPTSQLSDAEEQFSDDGYPVKPRYDNPNMSKAPRGRSRSPSPQAGGNRRVVKKNILEEIAETTIGVAVKMKGELSFDRLLRIDGEFEGTLNSKGSLIIGAQGQLTGPVNNMKELVVDGGVLVGDVSVEKVTLRGKGRIHGDVTCKTIIVEPNCVMVGTLNVNPNAPEKIDVTGQAIKAPVEKKEKKKKKKADEDDNEQAEKEETTDKDASDEES